MTARLVPFTVDGLIWAASMVVLDASRHHGWRRGTWVPVSWQRLVRIWHLGRGRKCADQALPQQAMDAPLLHERASTFVCVKPRISPITRW